MCVFRYLQFGVGDDVIVVDVKQFQHVSAVAGRRPPRPQSIVAVQVVWQ